MTKADVINRAREIFTLNTMSGYSKWRDTDYKFIAPANQEYVYQWLWDTGFHAIVLSHFDTNWAKNEIRNFLKGQWADGFLPHIIFWGTKKRLPHWAYIESALSFRPRTTSITQPPVFPISVEEIYKKDNDRDFLKEVLPSLARHHRWLLENRDIDQDFLISIISPNESGMDELPVFQVAAGYRGLDTARLHFTYRRGDILNQRYRFAHKKILEKDYFNVEELLFNTVFIESARSLSRLFHAIGNEPESTYFQLVADKGERSLLTKCWNEKDQIFYSLYSKEEKFADVKTVASLVPLFLDGLSGSHLRTLVEDHLKNPNEFFTNYPFPSVSKDEKYYFPSETPWKQIKLLWRGPTWIATNWFVIKGLQKHGYDALAKDVIARTTDMIEKYGFREYYNPEDGTGYRRENFGWSTLLLDLMD